MSRASTWSSTGRIGHVRRCAILLRSAMRCAWCGELLTKDSAQIDHVIPRVAGGPDTNDNLVGSCADCNICRPEGFEAHLRAVLSVELDLAAGRRLALEWYPSFEARIQKQNAGRAARRRRASESAARAGLAGVAFPFGALAS